MLYKRTHNWRIRHQIFLLQFTALMFLIIILLFALFLLLYIAYYNNKEGSTNILINKLMPKYSFFAQYYYKRSITQQFDKFSKQLYNVNKIYQFNVEFNVYFNMTLETCDEKEYPKDDIIPYTQFCYSIRNPIQNYTIDSFLALSKQLTLVLSMFDSTEGYYFTSVSEEQYFSLFPMSFMEGFYPHTRPWYKRQISSQAEQVYSEPYLDFDPRNGIMITLTQELQNLDWQLKGVVGMDIVTRQFPQFDYMKLNSYIIDEKGRIIVSKRNQENDTDVSYFYQEQITGYNQSDFENLLNFIKYDKIPDQSCMGQRVPCMENKLKNEYEMGYGSYLKINDYILIILMNTKFYQEYFDLLEQIITDSLFANIKVVIGILCGNLMLFIIVQLIAAQYLQKPIERILIQILQIIKDHSQAKLIKQPTFIQNYEVIEELTCAFNRLVASMDRNDLQFLEKDKMYPTKMISFYYYIRQINFDELKLWNHHKLSSEARQKWIKIIQQIQKNQRKENIHSFNFIDSL